MTKYGYDGDLNRISVTDALNRETAMEYGRKGNMIAARDPAGNTTRLSYEPTYNQPLTVTDPKGASTSMRYDIRGNLMEVTDALGNKTEMSYDALGHVTGTKDPLGNVSAFEYDSYGALGKVTDPLNRVTLMTRDNLSRVTQTKDPSNKLTLFDYDVKGNLTRVTDALNGITEYGYTGGCAACGGGDLLASVRDAKNQLTSFQYDLQKRLTGTTNPLSQSKTFAYDKKGKLTNIVHATNKSINLEYDVLDRLTYKRLPEGDVSYSYDVVGNFASVTTPDIALTVEHDTLDRVTRQVQTLAGASYETNYTYDANGNKTSMSTPWGTFHYTYNALNRLTSLTNPEGKVVLFEYDALGRRTRMSYPNGTQTSYSFDAASQLTQVLHRKIADSSAIDFAEYGYDPAGNKTSQRDAKGVHTYSYDDIHRLTGATHPDMPDETFEYDSVGNRTADAERTGHVYDAANRLIEDSSYTYQYDAEGSLTRRTGKAGGAHTDYTYNSQNQLIRVDLPDGKAVTLKYDDWNRRIEKAIIDGANTTTRRYVYDKDGALLALLDGNNSLLQLFTSGDGINQPLIVKNVQGNAEYYYQHGLHGPVAITDNMGAVVERMEYTAYGEPTITAPDGTPRTASEIGNAFLYTGNEYDAELGLYNMQFRMYDPKIGRFTAADPIGREGGDENLYAYVLNNPITWIDPWGLCYITPEEGQKIVDEATTWEGTPYVGGGTKKGPDGGADCSGSTWQIYVDAGFDYKRMRATPYSSSSSFGEVKDPQPGDVVWWKGHVAIYAGNGMMWTAHRPGGARYNKMLVQYWSATKPKYYRLKTECEKGFFGKIWDLIKSITK